ncbi:hypothetical protein [Nocardia vermiculata]|uniref:Mce-associated membrane protein n=2 Tax=Nocardia vermiculata TaxID=257274 RepID=A0A846XWR2_9NOCA|nr:hypothetical protein [Nocardia vermiculata]NKY48599.1 hypothetical protein [Nocardia vermiculata]
MSSDLPKPTSQPAKEPADAADSPVADATRAPVEGGGADDATVRAETGATTGGGDDSLRTEAGTGGTVGASDATVRMNADATVRTDADATVRTDTDATVRMPAEQTARIDTDETVRMGVAQAVRNSGGSVGAPAPASAAESVSVSDSGRSVLRTVVTSVAAVWLVAAVVAAAWFGAGWVRAMWFTDGPRTDARDMALDAARQAAVNLTSMNPADVDGSVATMRSSMTGDMLTQLNENQDRIKDAAVKSKTGIDSKVLGASLSSLDSERDKATAIVVLKLTQTAPNVPVQSFRATWTLDMKKDGDTWKTEQANSLGQLVTLDTPGPAGAPQPDAAAPAQPNAAPAPPDAAQPSQAPAPQPGS